ncbi:hypothetical protein N8J89_23595 [Crossiella sp. CA-258035]|uniref:hypothetical protein n=1 Tax=Crossiella sp. CA-258035 TaxID=2981138 RepID=UPI0024BC512A|nr:hypothetical protein [Crossiella sp. CA-258035]WHT16116.1 hypothetical protein N8J89_23595 [Crossiella sp. CA-258035]
MTDQTGRVRRGWRLALVVFLQVVAAGLPALLVAAYRDRLPERAWVQGWARIWPEHAQLAPGWDRWAAGYLGCLAMAAILLACFARYWRWAGPQRLVVAASWAVATQVASSAALVLASVLTAAPEIRPTPGWVNLVSLLLAPLGGLIGWLLASPLPRPAPAAAAPPPHVERRQLTGTEQAMFSTTLWSARQLAGGGLLVAAGVLPLLAHWPDPTLALPLPVLGLLLSLQAKAKLRVDGDGITLAFPLLGGMRQHVGYREIRFAEVAGRRVSWSGRVDNPRAWGFLTRSGPALVAHLADGRELVASPRDPAVAVALVNGQLDRARAC